MNLVDEQCSCDDRRRGRVCRALTAVTRTQLLRLAGYNIFNRRARARTFKGRVGNAVRKTKGANMTFVFFAFRRILNRLVARRFFHFLRGISRYRPCEIIGERASDVHRFRYAPTS